MPVEFAPAQYIRGGGGGGGRGGSGWDEAVLRHNAAMHGADVQQSEAILRSEAEADANNARRYAASVGANAEVQSADIRSNAAMDQEAMQQQGQNYRQEQRQNFEWSQADQLRLQRMQQGRAVIQQQVADRTLTAEEGQQMMGLVQSGIEPLVYQREQSQRQRESVAVQKETRNIAFQDQLQRTRQGLMTQAAQNGEGTFRLRDPENPGQFLPGLYQFDHNGARVPVATAGGGASSRSASGAGGGRGAGPDPDRIRQQIRSETTAGAAGGTEPRFNTPEAETAEFERRVRQHHEDQDTQERVTQEHRRRQIGGPAPFPNVPPASGKGGAPVLNLASHINRGVMIANQQGNTRLEERLRRVAPLLEQGRPTGALSPEDQQALQAIGYYRGQFTPDIDTSIYRATLPPAERLPGGGQGVRMQDRTPDPVRARQGQVMRMNLGTYGTRDAMTDTARQAFDVARRALGFAEWPPRSAGERNSDTTAAAGIAPQRGPAPAPAQSPSQVSEAERRRREQLNELNRRGGFSGH